MAYREDIDGPPADEDGWECDVCGHVNWGGGHCEACHCGADGSLPGFWICPRCDARNDADGRARCRGCGLLVDAEPAAAEWDGEDGDEPPVDPDLGVAP